MFYTVSTVSGRHNNIAAPFHIVNDIVVRCLTLRNSIRYVRAKNDGEKQEANVKNTHRKLKSKELTISSLFQIVISTKNHGFPTNLTFTLIYTNTPFMYIGGYEIFLSSYKVGSHFYRIIYDAGA